MGFSKWLRRHMMNEIKAIIFDLEGVIADTHPAWAEADRKFLRRRNYILDENTHHPMMTGRNLEEGVEIMRSTYPFKGETKELARERIGIFTSLLESQISFISGFERFYNSVAGKYLLAVGTSLDKTLLPLVEENLRLSKLFGSHIYCIADVGYLSKPHPDIFLHAAKNLEVTPENCVVIEDAPNGISAAKNAGMKCIALTTTFTREKLLEADLIVDSYSEIDLNKI